MFQGHFGGTAPVSPVGGSFNISFDPTVSYLNQTAGITLDSLYINLGSPLSFSYEPGNDVLRVGGLSGGADIIYFNPPSDDFWLYLGNFASGTPTFLQLGYTQANFDPLNYFYTGNLTGGVGVSPTPLPASLPLFASGLGLLTMVGLRRCKASTGRRDV